MNKIIALVFSYKQMKIISEYIRFEKSIATNRNTLFSRSNQLLKF
jgi:hypothetical protein